MLRPMMFTLLMGVLGAGTAWADYASGVRAWNHADYPAAAAAFLPAARAGDAEAQFMMGRLYALGDGVPQDFVQAWLWHDRAARQGHALAAQARDALGDILNARQQAQVRMALPPPPAPAPPPAPVVSERSVLLLPRNGVVTERAHLSAPAATEEGRLLAMADPDTMVRALQRALAREGFDPGPIDGDMGSATRRAIRAYQSAHGEPPNGLVTDAVVRRLGIADQQQAAR